MSAARTLNAADTERVGGELAERLKPGDLVLVTGELGAGKTTLVRGAFRALGMSGPVVSPTFTIGRRYEGRDGVRLSHLDLYRLADLGAEDPGLLEDYLTPDAIAFVEWPAVALVEMPKPTVCVAMHHAGGDERDISVEWARS
ncbi:MAG: tRNA (adenosine(37)-N6)-threonylcarbamoyltransferase complex ATPase subunit type 1 TsaE [Solirubrobacterales bacterium]